MRCNTISFLQRRCNHFTAAHLGKCEANYAHLSPLTALKRSVKLFPNKPAYTYDDKVVTYSTMGVRVSQFASALLKRGVIKGDVVSVMTSNTPPLLEAHLALPGAGLVLHPLNIRLDAATIAYQLKHSEAKIVIVDSEFNNVMAETKAILVASNDPVPAFVNVRDPSYEKDKDIASAELVGNIEYDQFLDSGDATYEIPPCADEWDAISLNYTSGTTGNPKGVVGSHRSAYLASLTHIVEWNMEQFAGVVMITPMFHANGWAFPWTLCNLSGCAHLVRNVRAAQIFQLFEKYNPRYLIGAPITMTTLLSHPERKRFPETVKFLTAGSPPPPSLIQRFAEELNVDVTTSYGLTETITVITKHKPEPEWFTTNNLTPAERFARCTRQAMDSVAEQVCVMNPESMTEVPADGVTVGEVMIKSNSMMKGYFKNPQATHEAFEHGWFHTGDLAVNHGLGRFEIKDRSKDIIISGGENISSIEVQDILATHPSVLEAAVVAMPDEKWGEVPCAFVTLVPSAPELSEAELIAWARTKMPHFQAPKRVIFGELLKTATGKVQKHLLRKLL